jgi:Ricin-type beta-trefoil lectin domain
LALRSSLAGNIRLRAESFSGERIVKNPVRYAIGTMSLRVLRRLCASIAVTSVLILGAGPLAAAPANAAAKALPASVLIKNEATGLCLDDTSPGRVRVIEAKCGAPGHFQHWRVYAHSGYVKIHLSINLAFCLNAVVGTGGVTIKLCRSNDLNQNWIPTKVGSLFRRYENSANDRCLDGSLTFGVRVATCISTDTNQLWASSS